MNFRKVWHIARYEYWSHVRRWGYLFATFGIPLLVGVGLLVLRWVLERPQWRDYLAVDMEKPIGVVLPEGFDAALPQPFVRVQDEVQGQERVLQGQLLALLVVPPEGPDAATPWTLYTTGGWTFIHDTALYQGLQRLKAYLLVGDRLSPQELEQLLTPPPIETITLGPSSGQARQGRQLMGAYMLAVVFFVGIFVSSGYLLQSVAQEKESRMIEVLLASVTATELLWGKLVGLSGLGLTQMGVWTLALLGFRSWTMGTPMESVLGLSWEPAFLAVGAAALVLGYLMYGLLMAGFGALGTTVRESQQFSVLVSMSAMLPIFFNSLFFLNPNGVIPRSLSYFPWSAPLALLMRLAITPLPWWELALIFGAMVLGVAVSFWAGVRLFRVGLLMFGKRPSWREVLALLRRPV